MQRIGAAPPAKGAAAECGYLGRMDEVTRQSHIRLIRSIVRAYRPFGMQLLVDQATIGKSRVEDLDDDSLINLHRDIERALECIQDGITFTEAGLIRTRLS